MHRTLKHLLLFFSLLISARGQYVTADGKVAVPPRRVDSWVYSGGDREIVEVTISRIDKIEGSGPGAWSYEWGKVAGHYEKRGDQLSREAAHAPAYEKRGKIERAQWNYLKAQLYYAIGYFPDNRTAEQRASYRKHVETFLKAGQFFTLPLEVVKVPYRGTHITVHLHRPEGVDSPPLVLWSGGVDWWKGSIYPEIRTAIGRGLAVAAFDLAGTGELDQFPATPEADDVHRAVIDYFGKHGFDPSRMAYVGTSFGGFYAVKLAAANAGLKAAVNICGANASAPLTIEEAARSYAQRLAGPEGGTVRAVAKALGVEAGDSRAMAQKMAGFNLVTQGLVGGGRKIKIPLLNINGSRDPSFPWQGYLHIVGASENPDLWLLGSSGHCARDYFTNVAPQLADWLVEKLR